MTTRIAAWPRWLVLGAVAALALGIWRAELFQVQSAAEPARALVLRAAERRRPAALDVELPGVPEGARLAPDGRVLIVQFWAPWERRALVQATALDSLHRASEWRGLRPVLVTFDPFPSVARYVGRRRLRVPVLFDHQRRLADVLPCPRLPTAYVVDANGRVAAEMVGEVDWLAPGSVRALRALLAEREAMLGEVR